ncbi:MAG: 50S ribosomal protein L10 [Patescibacteria group bacterium]
MPKTRAQKEQQVTEAVERFARMKAAVFAQVGGFTMADADELREKARQAGMSIFIMKKTLLTRAMQEAKIEGVDARMFDGSILTVIGFEDEVSPAKTIANFLKKHESLTILSGILENKLIDEAMVKRLAGLPSKQQLLGQLVGTLNAPISGFVNVLAGNLRGLVTVLNAINEKKV